MEFHGPSGLMAVEVNQEPIMNGVGPNHFFVFCFPPGKYTFRYLDRMIDEHKAADFLGYTIRALQNWRVRGGGPKFVKVSGRSIRYRRRDLIEWAEGLLVASTSEV